jgi:hypothetical protein
MKYYVPYRLVFRVYLLFTCSHKFFGATKDASSFASTERKSVCVCVCVCGGGGGGSACLWLCRWGP